jgi:hypothetical protein
MGDAAAFAEKVHNCELVVPSRESHIRPLLARLELDTRPRDLAPPRRLSQARFLIDPLAVGVGLASSVSDPTLGARP